MFTATLSNHPLNVAATARTLQSWCLAEPQGPGVNLWLITTRRARLSRVICLSLHPFKETLRSLPLLRPAVCPPVNPAERPGSGGGAKRSPRGSVPSLLLLPGPMSSSGSPRELWVSAAGTTTNGAQAFVQMLFFVDQPHDMFACFSWSLIKTCQQNATDVSLSEAPQHSLVKRPLLFLLLQLNSPQ